MSEDTDDDRKATERGRYLARRHGLNGNVARAVAYRELGYSPSGIAHNLDTTEPTVRNWMEQIAEQFGEWAIETKWEEQRTGGLDE